MEIDLSTNYNFLSPKVEIDLSKIKVNEATNFTKLYQVISEHYKINSSFIELYSGTNNALYKIIDSIDSKNCYVYAPIDTIYRETLYLKNINVEYINRYVDINHEIEENSIVIFQNPSVPDGSYYNLLALLDYWAYKKAHVIIDESYLEFTSFESVSKYMLNYSNLFILKSFEYFYNTPAIKTAFVISNEINIAKLKMYNIQHDISPYDNLYIQEMLKDTNFSRVSKAVNASSKAHLEQIIKEYNIFHQTVYSYTNVILVKLNGITGSDLAILLDKFDILVEDCSPYIFLDDNYVKITAKSSKEMKTLEKVLESFTNK